MMIPRKSRVEEENTSPLIPTVWQPPVYIIAGEQGEGKTTFLMDILDELQGRGVCMNGIVAPGYFHEGLRSGFSLVDVATGISKELCSEYPSPDSEQHGRYYFQKTGISFGNRAILGLLEEGNTDLLVIDEVGRFELNGALWAGAIDRIMGMHHPPMIWTIRRSFVDAVLRKWPIKRTVVVDIGSSSPSGIIPDIMREVSIFRS